MNDDELRTDRDNETIPLSREQDAQFSGRTIFFPPREGESAPAEGNALPPARDPIEDRTEKPSRSFLSFFDAPEGETPPESADGETAEPPADADDSDETEEESLSFDEFVQKEVDEETREDLDNLIRQNDADSLFALGQQYGSEAVPEPNEPPEGDEVSINPTSILEAMLFVGNRENKPLPIDKAASLMRNVTSDDILKSVAQLNARYTKTAAPYRVVEKEEGLVLELRPEYDSVRQRFFGKVRDAKLTQNQIDILALIAYRQPITAAEIAQVRSQAGNILNALLKRNLIEITPGETPDAPAVYRTTDRLLKILGINSISDLPIVDELDYR
ncbi:MAG: SMC-Scp complex subunit ScpB [Thermoguttaceae bacterium]|nr:SMC-Scp complex subunit ScpB [Thermoguttaceae bacterium]